LKVLKVLETSTFHVSIQSTFCEPSSAHDW